MKRQRFAAEFKNIIKLLGGRGIFWISISIISAFILSLVEYSIAGFIQLFLTKIDLFDPERLPHFLQLLTWIQLGPLLVILGIIGSVRSLASYFVNQSAKIFLELFNTRMRLICFYDLLKRNSGFIPSSYINYQIAEVFPKASQFIFFGSIAASSLIQIVGLMIGLLFVAWRESIVGVLGLFFLSIAIRILNRNILKLGKKIPDAQSQINRTLERVLRNWIFIKISKLQEKEYGTLVANTLAYSNGLLRSMHFANLAGVLPPAFGIILLSAIILLSQKYFLTNSTNLLLFLYLFIRFVQIIGTFVLQVSNAFSYRFQFSEAARYFFKFDDSDIHHALLPLNVATNKNPADLETHQQLKSRNDDVLLITPPDIRVRNLSFNWSELGGATLFSNLDIDLIGGKILVIVGPSGSGKSTLLNLILGQLEPTSGDIFLGELSPKDFLNRLGDRIGYVGTDPFIIDGSIRENLLYGLGQNVSDDILWKSLAFAKLDSVVKGLQNQLAYHINEIGEGLSTGQKQRLALARAWLRQPLLWILDEATANLDRNTELLINETFSNLRGQATIVFVTHRPEPIKIADQVVELD